MSLDLKSYLVLTGLIVIPLAMSFLFIRKGSRPPVQLQMQAGGKDERPVAKETMPAPSKPANRPAKPAPQAQRTAAQSKYDTLVDQDFDTSPGEKVLNVLFQWNGHSWDAYEVLGIPAGSSREAALSAYQKHASQADAQSQPFYKAAYEAITKATGTRG